MKFLALMLTLLPCFGQIPRPSNFAATASDAPVFDTVNVKVAWNGTLEPGDYWRWTFESPATNGAGFTTNNQVALSFTISATNVFMIRGERNLTNSSGWSSADWLPYRTNYMIILPGLERAATPKGPWANITNSLPWTLSGASNIFVRPKYASSNWIEIWRVQ